jgi:DNA polymerase-1
MKNLYLVDVSSIFFRAYYAIRQLNNSKGMPTNALYGFLAAITKLLKEHKPGGIVFCYDRPESGFREELYPDYKANRDEAPADLVLQIPYLKKLADALSIPGFDKLGFEADDIIGCLVKLCRRRGVEVVIVSGDKDFGQLVEPGVSIFDPAKDAFMDSAGVQAKWGITPSQVVDYLALVGDSSDNVPGVKGIGPKGAQKLLAEFHSLDGIYKNLDQLKNDRIRELLRSEKDIAYLSQKLCTIHCDEPLDVKLEDLKIKPIRRELLEPLLNELDFKALLQKLLGSSNFQNVGDTKAEGKTAEVRIAGVRIAEVRIAEVRIAEVRTVEEEKTGAQIASEGEPQTISVGQTKVSPEAIVTASVADLQNAISNNKSGAIWLDITNRGLGVKIGLNCFRFEGASDNLTEWLNETLVKHKFAVSGFDTKGMAHQIKLSRNAFTKVGQDVMLEAYCTGRGGDMSLSDLAKKYLGAELPEFALPEERLSAVQQLSQIFLETLKKEGTDKILKDIEEPLVPVLFKMELDGIKLNTLQLEAYSKELGSEILTTEKEIISLAGVEFNIGSPKQLGQVLFERLKLPTVRKTKTGYSTDSDVLEVLKSHHEIAAKILNWRELSKLRSTYVDALPRIMDPKTGRVHTSFNQAVTTTGRLSSTQPNLQNIPIRSARGERIRESFVSDENYCLLTADYSQIELRILAHVTGDKALSRAFEYDLDIHTATASEIFNTPLSEVTSEQRRASKAINFGIVYGMSDFGLAENLGVERKVAGEFIEQYFLRYPGVQKYMHEVIEQGKEDGFVQTMFGRKRYYPDLKSSNYRARQNAERAAINMPIQGAAADLIKLAMIEVDKNLTRDATDSAKMLLQVHDELIFEVSEGQVEVLREKVRTWMENTTKLNVPLKVSIGVGSSWGNAE